MAVTQSGETADTIAAARLAGDRGAVVVAVTNTVGSAITRESHASVFLQAGPEVAVAATKTFVTQVATAGHARRGRGPPAGPPDRAKRNSSWSTALRRLAGPGRASHRAGRLDRGDGRALRRRGRLHVHRPRPSATRPPSEGALKIKEISYLHAEGYAAGELKHGPISLLDPDVPLVAVATRSAVYEKLISNLMEGRARDARVLAVATEGDAQIERLATDVLLGPGHAGAAEHDPGRDPAAALRLLRGGRSAVATWTSRATSPSR